MEVPEIERFAQEPVTTDLEWGHGIVVAPALPVLVEAGVELRLLAL